MNYTWMAFLFYFVSFLVKMLQMLTRQFGQNQNNENNTKMVYIPREIRFVTTFMVELKTIDTVLPKILLV